MKQSMSLSRKSRLFLKTTGETNGHRQRHYNLRLANGIAILIPGDDIATESGTLFSKAGTLLSKARTGTWRVSMKLMHPGGKDGWTYKVYYLIPKHEVPPACLLLDEEVDPQETGLKNSVSHQGHVCNDH
jgi:hypothetical protein